MKSKTGAGFFAGLVSAFICGIVMSCVGVYMPDGNPSMMDLAGRLVGSSSAAAGWLNTLIVGCILGGIFAGLFGSRIFSLKGGLNYGLIYGLCLWVLGGLIVTPMLLGMPAFGPFAIAGMQPLAWFGLLDYVAYALVLGTCFFAMYKPGIIEAVKNVGERVGAGRT
jgi:hypothetical protein